MPVIGVVEDFHFQHLSNEIQPLLFMFSDQKKRMFVSYQDDFDNVYPIIKNHHGKIEVLSKKRKGSLFRIIFRLPEKTMKLE